MTDDLPDLPDFDERRTRWAVRRGLLRTATLVIAILVAVTVLSTLGSRWIQQRGDREDRMVAVLGQALQIANPGYVIVQDECCDTSLTSMGFKVAIRPLRAHGGFFVRGSFADRTFDVEQSLFGRVKSPPMGYATETSLTYGLYNVGTGNQPKEQSRKVLARLPEDMNALAVVEFAKPMTTEEAQAFRLRHEVSPTRVVYENRPRATPITWGVGDFPTPMPKDESEVAADFALELKGLRGWVATLRDHDEANLRPFGLDLARLRKAAADGLAYAYVDELVTVKKLRKLIEDPLVRTVRVADLSYDLARP